jgi:DNA-binding HxlR family transcriptional regulator
LAEIQAYDCDYSPGIGAFDLSELNRRSTRRSSSANAIRKRLESPSVNALAVIGDRWTFVILRAMFAGASRFDDIQAETGIARNILANRLRTSETNGLVSRRAYQTRPVRYEYKLTEMGQSLYPSILALVNWANRWITGNSEDKVRLRHLPCGRKLGLRVICANCREDISSHDVTAEVSHGSAGHSVHDGRPRTARAASGALPPAAQAGRRSQSRTSRSLSIRIRNPAMKR